MTNNGRAESPNEAGIFSPGDYADCSVFHDSGNKDQTLTSISVPAIETPLIATPPVSKSSSRSSRRVLGTLRVIRADITGVVARTINPGTLGAEFQNGVGSIPVGGNSPSIGGWIVLPPVIQH